MASSCSHRQRVEWLKWATRPCWEMCCVSSSKLQRESGALCRAGSSQAKALTCTTTSGGKRPRATRSRTFLQTGESLFEEAFAPLTDDFPPGVQATRDGVIGPTFGGVKDHFGAEHLKI